MCIAFLDYDIRQRGAVKESSLSYRCYVARNSDRGQFLTIIERRTTNAGDTIRYGDAFEIFAVGK